MTNRGLDAEQRHDRYVVLVDRLEEVAAETQAVTDRLWKLASELHDMIVDDLIEDRRAPS